MKDREPIQLEVEGPDEREEGLYRCALLCHFHSLSGPIHQGRDQGTDQGWSRGCSNWPCSALVSRWKTLGFRAASCARLLGRYIPWKGGERR
jgi:hypothetical protein